MMKTNQTFGIAIVFIALMFAVVIANFKQPAFAAQNTSAAAIALQVTPTPTPLPQDVSVIGSTDGIMLMGAVIAVIVIIPVIFRLRKK